MLRKTTVISTEWDAFCMMAYNTASHGATGECPFFVLHRLPPVFPFNIVPNGGLWWYSMDKALEEYRAEILQAVEETNKRVRAYNERENEETVRQGK